MQSASMIPPVDGMGVLGRTEGSKLSASDGFVLDSVLGDTSRDVLLKAVINKSEFTAKRLEDVNEKMNKLLETNHKDQLKTNQYLMEQSSASQEQFAEYTEQSDKRMRSNNDTMKLMQ